MKPKLLFWIIALSLLFIYNSNYAFAKFNQTDVDNNTLLYVFSGRNVTFDGSRYNSTNGSVQGAVTFNNDAGARFSGSAPDRVNFSATPTTSDPHLNSMKSFLVTWWYGGPKVMKDVGVFATKSLSNFLPCPSGWAIRTRTAPANKWQAVYCLTAAEGNLQVDVTDLTDWHDNDNFVCMWTHYNITGTTLEIAMGVNGTGLYGTIGKVLATGSGTLEAGSSAREVVLGGYPDSTGTLQGNISHLSILNITDNAQFNLTQAVNFTCNGGVRRNLTTYTQAGVSSTDTTLPQVNVSNFNTTSFLVGRALNFSCNATDNSGLKFVNSSHNATGIGLVKFNASVSGTSFILHNQTISLPSACGGALPVINFTCYATDTSGNTNQNSTIVIVNNTAPTQVSIFNGTDKTVKRNVTINWTSTDNDVCTEQSLYTGWFNGNPFSTNDLNFTTNMVNDGTYFLNISVADAFMNQSNNTRGWNISLDVTTPLCPLTDLPENGTAYSNLTGNERNISGCTASDSNLFEYNISVYNISTSGVQKLVYSNSTINISPTKTTLTDVFLINASWGEGNKNVSVWVGDTKNRKRSMSDWKVAKAEDNRSVQFNHSLTGLQCNISFGSTNPAKKRFLPLQANVSLKMSITYKNDDFYKIAYDVVAPNTGFVSGTKFLCNQQIIQVYDDLAGHLLLGTGKERLSYDAQDLIDSGFNVTTILGEDDNKFMQVIEKSGIVEGAIVSYDPRADNLNIVELSSIVQVDLTAPTIFLNLSNNTFTNGGIVNITYNITDALRNNLTAILYLNDVKNTTRSYTNLDFQNISFNMSANITRNFTIVLSANDTAGNFINSTTRVIVIDTQAPIDVNASNRTRTNEKIITTVTDVNISVFVGDIYLSAGNFSHNASGDWVTLAPLTITGNSTYNYIIGAGNFTAKQVVGWKYNFTDRANNLLDPIFTFEVQSSPVSAPAPASSGVPVGSQVLNVGAQPALLTGKCSEGNQYLGGACYPCSKGILFKRENGQVVCVNCNEGFEYDGQGGCQLKKSKSTINQNTFLEILDNWSAKISPTNPLIGFVLLLSIGSVGIYWFMAKKWF